MLKVPIGVVLFCVISISYCRNDYTEQVLRALERNVLYMKENAKEMNLDAMFGLVIAQANLQQLLLDGVPEAFKSKVRLLEYMTDEALRKTKPYLKKDLKDGLFSQTILIPKAWRKPINFVTDSLNASYVHKSALKDVNTWERYAKYLATGNLTEMDSDNCFMELLMQQPYCCVKHRCKISPNCQKLMIRNLRDTVPGYGVTHNLLYLQVARSQECLLNKFYVNHKINEYCSYIYWEAKRNEQFGFIGIIDDLLLEQVTLCGFEGFTEFLKDSIIEHVLLLQRDNGCFKLLDTHFRSKRDSHTLSDGCVDHTTGLVPGTVLCNSRGDEATVEITEIIFSIESLLNFVEKYYYQMNLDGVLGITLAQAQLEQIIYSDSTSDYFTVLSDIIDKCQYLKQKIVPLLPDEPDKFRFFKDILLDSSFWYHKIDFGSESLEDMGIYQNWTLEYILSNKEAIFNGIHTDVCLVEILRENYEVQAFKDCYVSPLCLVMMLAHRTDTMYLLTHRLLYLQIARQTKCVMGDNVSKELIKHYCSLVWKEAKTNEFLGFPQHDIFIEGVVLCGMEGFSEFASNAWRRKIRNWQTIHGCYTLDDKNLDPMKRRSTNIIEFGCTDHTTGLALASLAMHLRFIMVSDKTDL